MTSLTFYGGAGEIGGNNRYNPERSRLSHHLKDLKNDEFIEIEKEGKNIKIKITNLGKIYIQRVSK